MDGGTIKCEISDTESNTSFSIQRDIESDSRVYKEGVMDYTDTLILNQIEIYSQGDLQEIARQESLRLQLIDRPKLTEIKAIKKNQKQIASQLEEIRPRIKNLRTRVNLLKNQIRYELRNLLKTEQENRPRLSQQLDEQRGLYLKRKKALEFFNQILEVKNDVLDNSFSQNAEKLKTLHENIESLELPEAQGLTKSITPFTNLIDVILKEVKKVEDLNLLSIKDSFEIDIERLNESYYSLVKVEQDATSP